MRNNILIATILSPHGVRGWVKLHWHGEDPLRAIEYKTLHDKTGAAFEIEEQRMQGKALGVKFKSIADRTAAEKLRGVGLFIDRARLPAPDADEFYHIDLIGMNARTADGKLLGTVRAVQNFGASDLLEIATPRGDVEYFAINNDTVKEINDDEQVIVIEPPVYDE